MDRTGLRSSDAFAGRRHSERQLCASSSNMAVAVHSKLDYACTSAVALAQLALFSGDRVGLLAYGQGIQQRLLPGRGSAHLRQLIELAGPGAGRSPARPTTCAPPPCLAGCSRDDR